jgi:hypothetical protein
MSIHWRQSRSQKNRPDNDQNYRSQIPELPETMHLLQKKKNPDCDDDRGTHQAANRASFAVAADFIVGHFFTK